MVWDLEGKRKKALKTFTNDDLAGELERRKSEKMLIFKQQLKETQRYAERLAASAIFGLDEHSDAKPKEKPLREINMGTKRFTSLCVMDEPGDGGACHRYKIMKTRNPNGGIYVPEQYADVKFQKGPVKENGVNGCFQEDLIAIVIDRLQCFQAGDFACRENALALTKLEEALHWLNHRTADRQARGVEGKSEL